MREEHKRAGTHCVANPRRLPPRSGGPPEPASIARGSGCGHLRGHRLDARCGLTDYRKSMDGRRESDELADVENAATGVLFRITHGFDVADTTTVFPFLNGNDAKSGLPRGLPESFSMTVGLIHPGRSSKIHVHPLVTQVTMVLDGSLEVRLGGPTMPTRLTFRVLQNEAVLVRPGTFLQLTNPTPLPCRTLYVVGPAYVADVDEQGDVTYEDAVTLDESWDELAAVEWRPARLQEANVTSERRMDALSRVRDRQAALERDGT